MFGQLGELPLALSFDDVLILPKYSEIDSRSDIDLSSKISSLITLKIPLITTNMDTVSGVDMAIAMGKMGGLSIIPRWDKPEVQADKIAKVKKEKVRVGASVGAKNGFKERAEMLANAGVDFLEIDTAHGHLRKSLQAAQHLVDKYKGKITIYGGIVATAEAAEEHFKIGVDGVNIGVGGGSICTTRIKTGCGMPTFASIVEVNKAAKKYGGYLIPLAGLEKSGDIVKSLAAGACAARGGNMFAGTDEAPGEIVEINGKKYKEYSGSTSKNQKLVQVNKDNSNKNSKYVNHVEGVEGYVTYKGSIKDLVENLLSGVRSGFSYSGAKNIEELQKNAEFIRVTPSGIVEGGVHHITQAN